MYVLQVGDYARTAGGPRGLPVGASRGGHDVAVARARVARAVVVHAQAGTSGH